MGKVEKLTPKQDSAMKFYGQSWINRLDKGAKLDKEAATKGAKWLYSFCNLKEPLVIFVASPLGCQLAAFLLRNVGKNVRGNVGENVWANVRRNVEANVWANVGANVWANVRENVEANVRANVRGNVGANVGANVWANVRRNVEENVRANVEANVGANVWANVRRNVEENVRGNVGENVWANVRRNVGENLGRFENYCWYGSFCQDAPWVAFIKFFEEQKICEIKNENFEAFAALIEANVYDAIQLDGAYIGCEMPIEVHRDSSGKLHSTSGLAIKWSDGWGFHSLWGVRFSEDLFEKVTSRKIAAKEALALGNIEQRMAALKFLGAESIIDDCDSLLIEKSAKGNSLYSLNGVTDRIEYALRYTCPSTGREYISFVDPEVGATKDADLAMAWKFGITKEQYQSMELES